MRPARHHAAQQQPTTEEPMKTISRVTQAIIIALALTIGANAQDTCKVKVRIASFNWDGSGEPRLDQMTPNQIEWWIKEGQKKFPKICITTENGAADYMIA